MLFGYCLKYLLLAKKKKKKVTYPKINILKVMMFLLGKKKKLIDIHNLSV